MAKYAIDITGVNKTLKVVAVVINGSRYQLLLGANWVTADLISRINAVAPLGMSVDGNIGDILETTDISTLDIIGQIDTVLDNFESYGEDVPHPDVIDDADKSDTPAGRAVLTYVGFNDTTTYGSTSGALHVSNYRIGSAHTDSGTSNVAAHGGSQGRWWLVSKGWTDDDGVVHDDYLPPGTDGHTDATGNPAGRYWAVDAGNEPSEYFRKTFSSIAAGDHAFKFHYCAPCIGPSYDNRTSPCPAGPDFSITVYESDGVTILNSFTSGPLPNDGIWKPISFPITLAATQDIVVSIRNNNFLPGNPDGNDFLIDELGIVEEVIQPYAGDTADAVADNFGNVQVGQTVTRDVKVNDTPCGTAATTYALVPGSEVNGTIVDNNDGTFDITPTAAGAGSFDYEIMCDGIVVDAATVVFNGTASSPANEGKVIVELFDPTTNTILATRELSAMEAVGQSPFTIVQDGLSPDVAYVVRVRRQTLGGTVQEASATEVVAVTVSEPC